MNDPLILPIDGPAVMDHSLRVIAPYFRSHSAPPCSKVLLAVVALDDNARRALVCRAQDTLGPQVSVTTHLLDARDPLTSFLDLLRQTPRGVMVAPILPSARNGQGGWYQAICRYHGFPNTQVRYFLPPVSVSVPEQERREDGHGRSRLVGSVAQLVRGRSRVHLGLRPPVTGALS